MRMTSKLAASLAAMLAAGAVALGTIVRDAERELGRERERSAADFTRVALSAIGRATERRLDHLRALARDPAVLEMIRETTGSARTAPSEGEGDLDLDRRWREGEDLDLVAWIERSALSRELRARVELLARTHGYPVFGELFVADATGRTVAMSRRTTDYVQSDEAWWIEAMSLGSAIGSLEYDESTAVHSTVLALRVDDGDRPIAVLKAVLDVREFSTIVESLAGAIGARQVALFTPEGRLAHHSDVGAPPRSAASGATPWGAFANDLAPGELRVDGSDPAASAVALRTGEGAPGVPDLTLVVREGTAGVVNPVSAMRARMATVGAVLVAAFLGLAAFLLVGFSRRIRRLNEAVRRLPEGALPVRFDVDGDDELAETARCLDRSATLLAETRRRLEQKTEEAESRSRLLLSEAVERAREAEEREALQGRLRSAQKLESIGQLAAGIAHEINTPIQYVGDNTRFLQDSSRDLLAFGARLRDLVRAHREGTVSDADVTAAERALEAAQLDFLEEEVPTAIEQSLEGLRRVAEIVHAMKRFAAPGTDERTPTDLNDALQSTIVVCRNEWKYVAELRAELDPALPPVPCHPGELNQALLGVIVNAADAIARAHGEDGPKGRIVVRTSVDGPWARVDVVDTGCGMTEEVRRRAFDPFFTTKEVGKGTGQGLALVHDTIVRLHGGRIDVASEVGRGTTMTLRLPLETADVEPVPAGVVAACAAP